MAGSEGHGKGKTVVIPEYVPILQASLAKDEPYFVLLHLLAT